MNFSSTADTCDANENLLASGELRVLQPIFQSYGKHRVFSGRVVTLRLHDNNQLAFEVLKSRGEGRVLVIDGGGSKKGALAGGMLCQLAQVMGWSGIVVKGYIRDSDQINSCNIGVKALGIYPMRAGKDSSGEKNVPVYIGGVWIQEGEWLYADGDGILVSKTELSVFEIANPFLQMFRDLGVQV